MDSVSGQVQSLNDSVDELKARIAKLDKSVSDLQTQLQAMQAAQAQQQPGAAGPGGTAAPGGPIRDPECRAEQRPAEQARNRRRRLQETLQAGVRDYTAGRYQVAQGEFQDVVHYYPLDDAAGTAQFYLGEIAYQQKDYPTAINDYNAVLEGFSGNAKASAAQLHKGFALIASDKREEGIHELRSLIQRHPQTPEARAARAKLTAMGVKAEATRVETQLSAVQAQNPCNAERVRGDSEMSSDLKRRKSPAKDGASFIGLESAIQLFAGAESMGTVPSGRWRQERRAQRLGRGSAGKWRPLSPRSCSGGHRRPAPRR